MEGREIRKQQREDKSGNAMHANQRKGQAKKGIGKQHNKGEQKRNRKENERKR